jgi:hypothetical protein
VGDCEVIAQAGVGLVPLIELGDLNNPELDELITELCSKNHRCWSRYTSPGLYTLSISCTNNPKQISSSNTSD